MKFSEEHLNTIFEKFRGTGSSRNFFVVSGGHINYTYKVVDGTKSYLLQGVNTNVFTHTERLFSNLTLLQEYNAAQKNESSIVPLLPTITGQWYVKEESFSVWWRLCPYIEEGESKEVVENTSQAQQAAKGFGQFIRDFSGIPVQKMQEVIPGFHSPLLRYIQLQEAIEKAPQHLLATAKNEIENSESFKWIVSEWSDTIQKKGVKNRVCHNDTKLSNCLLDKKNGAFLYVIDLDTVMAGYVLYDFGDMMRSFLIPIPETVAIEEPTEIDYSIFSAMTNGFFKGTGNTLTPSEVESLCFGGMLMTYLMAIRFLADFLNGNVYYQVKHENDNWMRAQNQFKKLEIFYANRARLEKIIQSEYAALK